ncbi:Alpha-protein kinase 1 [Gracilariopsis chorda]|uniref:Alpha-protein kinase 1 n=1 Tax=Gracilariopsis chorda TaxID=448386 RepID=A0A2V3IYJ8_9FLOR|nr:Alpha-protein kinase 1 [Gracilariopsis chorda]|eukprot:PXF46757.1 Alpha-protein kinase 1 [Gracilariopsis chorda]
MEPSESVHELSSSDVNPAFEDPPSAHLQKEIINDGYRMITRTLQEPLFELYCEAELESPQYVVQFEVFPFSAGGQRLAFQGRMLERMDGGTLKSILPVVVKLQMATTDFLSYSLAERTRICDLEANNTVRKHDITSNLLEKWYKLGTNKSVQVLSAEKVILTRGCAVDHISQHRFAVLHHLFKKLSLDAVLYQGAVGTVEEYLEGRFTKFLNNDGGHNSMVRANFPAAFAHWSWVNSGGLLMVSDIQGVRSGNSYVLTDPCVHSVGGGTYGITDLGMSGVEEFFFKHKCNGLCKDLQLKTDGSDVDVGALMNTRIVRVQDAKQDSEDPSNHTRITSDEERGEADARSDRKRDGLESKGLRRSGCSHVRRLSAPSQERRRTKRFTRTPTGFKDLQVEQASPKTVEDDQERWTKPTRFGGLMALLLRKSRTHRSSNKGTHP